VVFKVFATDSADSGCGRNWYPDVFRHFAVLLEICVVHGPHGIHDTGVIKLDCPPVDLLVLRELDVRYVESDIVSGQRLMFHSNGIDLVKFVPRCAGGHGSAVIRGRLLRVRGAGVHEGLVELLLLSVRVDLTLALVVLLAMIFFISLK